MAEGIKRPAAEGAYLTLREESCDEFIERRSRFIGYACPVQTEEEALAFLAKIRAQHWDATHNVYAYSLRAGQIRRFSDDGEPQGTAGLPTLEVLTKSGITDAAIVVTRYFGGVLLGAGGLVRAYSHAAGLALTAAGKVRMQMCSIAALCCDYGQYGKLSSLIPACGGVIDKADFGENVTLRFHMAPESLPAFGKQLADTTCGSVDYLVEDEGYFQFEEAQE